MIMHPLDLIKTRFQLQNNTISSSAQSQHYSGVRDCAAKMYRQEGLLSFWKGILPPILVETPKRAWKFFTFEQFQKMFLFGGDKPGALVSGQQDIIFYQFVTAVSPLDVFPGWTRLWSHRGRYSQSLRGRQSQNAIKPKPPVRGALHLVGQTLIVNSWNYRIFAGRWREKL